MKALNKHPKKVFMWHKVNELKSGIALQIWNTPGGQVYDVRKRVLND